MQTEAAELEVGDAFALRDQGSECRLRIVCGARAALCRFFLGIALAALVVVKAVSRQSSPQKL